ncbi:MAG: DNA topoisomerase VI subunit B [archaeon]|nr:DNA topoisomerase VI subunit B [Candidatus Bathyarchaeum sp.]
MVTFQEISPADFFYRNRDIAGFTNPSRAVFVSIREIVENSLDSADQISVPPEVYVRLTEEEAQPGTESGSGVYRLMVMDNGSGIAPRHIPSAFGQVLFGSNYKLKQARGTFGLGGKMSILYGQITTHKPVIIKSSTGGNKVYEFKMMIDIQRNRPVIMDRKTRRNKENWRGTIVEYSLEGDYYRAMSKVLEYLKQTALLTPYADIKFVDPKGRLYMFNKVTNKMPPPPTETLAHPYGVDVETLQRLFRVTTSKNLIEFMRKHFHRVGAGTSLSFLDFAEFLRTPDPKRLNSETLSQLIETNNKSAKFRKLFGTMDEKKLKALVKKTKTHNMADFLVTVYPKIDRSKILRLLASSRMVRSKNPKKLKPPEIVKLVRKMKKYPDFLPPDASCLSPLGEDLLRAGILKELKPDFIAVSQRKPSTYSGHPFIVETAIAYGGNIPKKDDIVVYRYANKIPLLYDEASDVSVKVIRSMNWRRYKVASGMPIAILVHLCSTKVPYKTVGKEFIADRPEVKIEILNGIREVARRLQTFLAKREHVAKEKKRLSVFAKYLPKIARFSADLAQKSETPDIELLLKSVRKYDEEGN